MSHAQPCLRQSNDSRSERVAAYVKPAVEVIGSLHELTLAPGLPAQPKIVGNDLDGLRLKPGSKSFPLSVS